ncbi:metallophosphoesterase [Bacillus pinisoli]|uniref:metallophosphoesterase n=1 Tax=Bacillus pinisoli TaxID=2901866 RepID=UPI001FF252C4
MYFLIGSFVLLLGLVIYMFMEAHRDVVQTIQVKPDEFPESFGTISIYFISDIHRRIISPSMLSSIKGKVDLVVIGGDLTEKRVPFTRVKENIKNLKELGPTYFVWGNNDYEVDYHELDSILLDYGIKILDNTAVSFESGQGEKLCLLGVDDYGTKRARLDLALFDAEEESFKILISHNPEIVKELKEQHGIKLVLSGHTHGGQIRFWKWGLHPKGGLKTMNGAKVFISNGYGTTFLPLRLGAPAESNLIIVSKK